MSEPYTEFSWFWPPRTDSRVKFKDEVVMPLWRGFPDVTAQFKLDGNRNMIAVSPEGDVTFWNRQLDDDKQPYQHKYTIQSALRDKILSIAPKGFWTVLDSELMHTKTTMVKNTVYLYDVLVWKSEHLLDISYGARYAIIAGLGLPTLPVLTDLDAKDTQDERGALLGQNNIFLAQNMPADQWDLAWKIAKRNDFIEGLVIKRTGAISRLEPGYQEYNNSSFMLRVRKPKKNYQF